jgi:hypothetical protein
MPLKDSCLVKGVDLKNVFYFLTLDPPFMANAVNTFMVVPYGNS